MAELEIRFLSRYNAPKKNKEVYCPLKHLSVSGLELNIFMLEKIEKREPV